MSNSQTCSLSEVSYSSWGLMKPEWITYKSLNLPCMILTKARKAAGTFCQPLSTKSGSSEVGDRAAPLQLTQIQGLRRHIPAGRTLVHGDNMEVTWTWAGEPRCARI